jgi:soluble lytic murein transglycosylase-like protein
LAKQQISLVFLTGAEMAAMVFHMPLLTTFLNLFILVSIAMQALIDIPCAVAKAEKDDVYRRVERDGTLSFTNVPSDQRFKKVDLVMMRPGTRLSIGRLEGTIVAESRRHRLDPALLTAVIKAESDFDPAALSHAGAMGLMQLMPETAMKLAIHDPFDPDENIAGGARYLRYLLDRFNGNLPLALAAYNAGATRVERYDTLPPIRETRRYVKKVLRYYRLFGNRSFSQPYMIEPFAPVTWARTAAFPVFPHP